VLGSEGGRDRAVERGKGERDKTQDLGFVLEHSSEGRIFVSSFSTGPPGDRGALHYSEVDP
jgi:hypothetical protein